VKILVTGGFGYVGGRLAQLLHGRGHAVILGSRRERTPPEWLPQAQVVRMDWNADEQLRRICYDVDAVVHLAGMNAHDCETNPDAALLFNGDATARLVRAAANVGTRRFLYASTAHVYGSNLIGIVTEDTVAGSVHPYGTSHIAGENAVLGATVRGMLEGVVVRMSNVVGAPADVTANCWTLLVNDLVLQILRTGRIVLYSSGAQRRDFIAMGETCRGLTHLLEVQPEVFDNRIFNLGSGLSQTVIEMAERVAARAHHVLGARPTISRRAPESSETSRGLSYMPRRLMNTGFTPAGDNALDKEIDLLIDFCIRHAVAAYR
jgi:UDP-glucose 4-epimerase